MVAYNIIHGLCCQEVLLHVGLCIFSDENINFLKNLI